MTQHSPIPAPGVDTARWHVRPPVIVAVPLVLLPVVCTAAGQAAVQIAGLSGAAAYLVPTAAVAVSVVIAFVIMLRAEPTLRSFGFRAPAPGTRAVWFLPPLVVVVIALAAGGIHVDPSVVAGILALCVAVAFGEEMVYRGLLIALFRQRGPRTAVAISAAVFGVLHLANLAGGVSVLYAILQVVFAALFGLVAAELAVLTGSLWPTIVWHAVYDAVSYLGGDALTTWTIVAAAVNCLLLAVTGVVLWRRLPATARA